MRSFFVNSNQLNGHLDKIFNQMENRWLSSPLKFRGIYDGISEEHITANFSSEIKFDTGKSQWRLTAELAGVQKDSLKLDAKEDHLFISGEKTKGLGLGKFEKVFRLPDGCDVEKIEAEFNDGILTLTVPLLEKKTIKSIQFKS